MTDVRTETLMQLTERAKQLAGVTHRVDMAEANHFADLDQLKEVGVVADIQRYIVKLEQGARERCTVANYGDVCKAVIADLREIIGAGTRS